MPCECRGGTPVGPCCSRPVSPALRGKAAIEGGPRRRSLGCTIHRRIAAYGRVMKTSLPVVTGFVSGISPQVNSFPREGIRHRRDNSVSACIGEFRTAKPARFVCVYVFLRLVGVEGGGGEASRRSRCMLFPFERWRLRRGGVGGGDGCCSCMTASADGSSRLLCAKRLGVVGGGPVQ